MQIVDSHCHLDYLEREGQDLSDIVARAAEAGVAKMVTISTKLSTFPDVLSVAERFDNVFCTVGVHPHEAGEEEGACDTARLVELAAHPKVVGIGETGLDYFYEHSPRDAQKRAFIAHIAAARETGLPLIVHTRDADGDTVEILRSEYEKGAFPGLIHCFSSGKTLAEDCVKLGMSISLSGIITFKSAESIRDTVSDLSIDSLLVETDAPYLAPVPMRGKKNEPAFVSHTLAKLAEIKGIGIAEAAEATTGNFHRLFTKVPRHCA